MDANWPKPPIKVIQDFAQRNPSLADPGPAVMWAVWTVEGLLYLDGLDQSQSGYPSRADEYDPEVIDINHVRWATGNAITALDLCAATLGRLYCPASSHHELDLRDFDPAIGSARQQARAATRRAALPPSMLSWVDGVLTDNRYVDTHGARNPFTHAWLSRHLQRGGGGGHLARTSFKMTQGSTQVLHNARDLVELSRDLSAEWVSNFLVVLDQL